MAPVCKLYDFMSTVLTMEISVTKNNGCVSSYKLNFQHWKLIFQKAHNFKSRGKLIKNESDFHGSSQIHIRQPGGIQTHYWKISLLFDIQFIRLFRINCLTKPEQMIETRPKKNSHQILCHDLKVWDGKTGTGGQGLRTLDSGLWSDKLC